MEFPSGKVYETKEDSEPIAEEIVKLIVSKNKSYLCAMDALEIARDKLLTTTYPKF